ncbi:sodium:proton antiporter [Meridianimarinicoccus roseus]|jgi:multicomponent Na+:H+ antiporter subunit E|uniref:Sodium:proton antiporter n=1 Tax=Meridianimarinicoccus roseus TaxID=2072018 RepID=A0A2V2LSD1_9RHOB|nr:Na+/H+ antiporter subunit E [Meridianimarinicoccus roseus]PWR04353.1 sodium:proton antiporter [Meridianimarinicoccus roseus]
MNLFAVNLLLAIVWVVLTDALTLSGLLSGFVLGYAALWIAQPLFGEAGLYFVRVLRVIQLVLYFAYDLTMSSFKVAAAVLRPGTVTTSGIIEMPLDVESDLEILLVANLISLTPGTLSLDVSEDRKTLYIHAMFAEDPAAEAQGLKDGMEHMVRRVFT